jgi:hypothetical protein
MQIISRGNLIAKKTADDKMANIAELENIKNFREKKMNIKKILF